MVPIGNYVHVERLRGNVHFKLIDVVGVFFSSVSSAFFDCVGDATDLIVMII